MTVNPDIKIYRNETKNIHHFDCSVSFFSVQAQSHPGDYIITNKGDTISAVIRFDLLRNKVVYQLAGSNEFKRVDDGNVKGFFWSENKNTTFMAINLPKKDKPTFVILLERGKINLYQFILRTGKLSTKRWYANKGDSSVVLINKQHFFGINKKIVQNLTNLLADNPNVLQVFKKRNQYSFRAVEDAIKMYNAY